MKESPAQLKALRLAAVAPLCYWRGGWYAPGPPTGERYRTDHRYAVDRELASRETVTVQTIRSCLRRLWLTMTNEIQTKPAVYCYLYTLTDAGSAVVEEAGAASCLAVVDPFIAAVRDQSTLRLLDRLNRGLPACSHEREDGLGFCGEAPESISHRLELKGHEFKAAIRGGVLPAAGRAAIGEVSAALRASAKGVINGKP